MYTKGLLLHDPSDISEEPRIWLRPSQKKIAYRELGPAQRTLQVLRTSHLKSPARLSGEVIINLAENGVPHDVFQELFRDGLEELVAGLVNWDGPDAMLHLWLAVCSAGGVKAARLAREAPGEARVRGYGQREFEDPEADDDDPLDQDLKSSKSTAWWADQTSGCPSSLEETVMVLLAAGFTPQNCAVLRAKLEKIIKTKIDNFVTKYRIEVPMSCSGFVVPGMCSGIEHQPYVN